MSESHMLESNVGIFIATASGIGCQLMAAALAHNHPGFLVVGYTSHLTGVRTAPFDESVDIALIDSHLKDGPTAGFEAARSIRASNPRVRVIILLDASERSMIVDAFRAGASGIFSRDDSFDLLCKCICAVHQGQIWANSEQLQAVVQALAQIPAPPAVLPKGLNGLTKREQELVQLVAEGMTNRDISKELHLSEHTVRNYLFRIFNKLGTSNRMELARFAWHREDKAEPAWDHEESEAVRLPGMRALPKSSIQMDLKKEQAAGLAYPNHRTP
jgi:two-component system nitrate/nitrite response regulator NarL